MNDLITEREIYLEEQLFLSNCAIIQKDAKIEQLMNTISDLQKLNAELMTQSGGLKHSFDVPPYFQRERDN